MSEAQLPTGLSERIALAHQALDACSSGELRLKHRRRIRAAFGPGETTRRQRVMLDRLCAERVLPIWFAGRPHDPGPQRMLQLAEKVLLGETDPASARREMDSFATELENLRDATGRVCSAGDAALKTLITALAGDDYSEDMPESTTDDDLDPYLWNAEYCAALAAGSYPEGPDEDVEARREFWLWYLSEAVPIAYGARR